MCCNRLSCIVVYSYSATVTTPQPNAATIISILPHKIYVSAYLNI